MGGVKRNCLVQEKRNYSEISYQDLLTYSMSSFLTHNKCVQEDTYSNVQVLVGGIMYRREMH
jgi:hypothetical protein